MRTAGNSIKFVDWTNSTPTAILTGESALLSNGLGTGFFPWQFAVLPNFPVSATDKTNWAYRKRPKIDLTNYVRPPLPYPHPLIPTAERALVEYMLYEDELDIGTLLDSLEDYLHRVGWDNRAKLYEVADFYGLPREKLEYWLNEADPENEG